MQPRRGSALTASNEVYAIGRGACKSAASASRGRRLTHMHTGIRHYLSRSHSCRADRAHVGGVTGGRVEDRELINEFLIESSENLTRLETEIVDLEQRPRDPGLLGSIFRTIHTIKGTCGFLAFSNLEGVTHIAENILSQLRNGERHLTPELTSLILETMDMIRKELASIEATLLESGETYDDLRRKLTLAGRRWT